MPTSGRRDRGRRVAARPPSRQVARVSSRVAVGRFSKMV